MNVMQFQDDIKHLPQQLPEVRHYFADGCYSREVIMPQGFCGVGALHKTNHHFVLSKGKIYVKNGNLDHILTAPYHGVTQPGDKRLIYALEDSIMTTFHVTNLTDIDEIGKHILGEEL